MCEARDTVYERLEKYVGVFPTTAYAAGNIYPLEDKGTIINFYVHHSSLILYKKVLYIPFKFEKYDVYLHNEGLQI